MLDFLKNKESKKEPYKTRGSQLDKDGYLFNTQFVVMPAVVLRLTFRAILPISMRGPTDINNPARPTGKFTVDNTIMAASVAPPSTPITPKELIATTATTVTKREREGGTMFIVGAIMTANIAG
ncbi:hypothetical protein MJ3_09713 [Salimicrobium jeotgali]|uniref:Uncharacterized protein n=1 Tax=Salimicrobium jeotgali TaxID=1230341 RepID=K2GA75_9BACI|nr:hypothetical protein MJ3_09713 [Salimicrobium jeotgali]